MDGLKDKKILLVEDDGPTRILAEIRLKKTGINDENVVMTCNGTNAVEIAKKQLFDLIIIDINIPGINGIQASKEIKSNYNGNSPKIIGWTGYNKNTFDKQDREVFDDIISKPTRKEDFQIAILNALEWSMAEKN